jgi:hypothetical protein
MEVVEILMHFINKENNMLNVEFRLRDDDEDSVRQDIIEYAYVEDFGYDETSGLLGSYSDFDDEFDLFDDEEEIYMDEESLLSFLNEYYTIYPDRIPSQEMN